MAALCATLHSTHRSKTIEGLQRLHRLVAGIDVHRMLHVATVLIEQPDGSIEQMSREFGGFRRDRCALAAWLAELRVELVVMESTGPRMTCASCAWSRATAALPSKTA